MTKSTVRKILDMLDFRPLEVVRSKVVTIPLLHNSNEVLTGKMNLAAGLVVESMMAKATASVVFLDAEGEVAVVGFETRCMLAFQRVTIRLRAVMGSGIE